MESIGEETSVDTWVMPTKPSSSQLMQHQEAKPHLSGPLEPLLAGDDYNIELPPAYNPPSLRRLKAPSSKEGEYYGALQDGSPHGRRHRSNTPCSFPWRGLIFWIQTYENVQ